MRLLTLMLKDVMDVILCQPGMECVSTFKDKPVHLRKHTALGVALPTPAHNTTVGAASPGVAEAKERGENKNQGTPRKDYAMTS